VEEYRFVLEFCFYEGLRKWFLPVYHYKRLSMVKFIELLKNEVCLLKRKLGVRFKMRLIFEHNFYVKNISQNFICFLSYNGFSCCMNVNITFLLVIGVHLQ